MTNVQYGFVDENNLLLEIIIFNDPDIAFLEKVKEQFNADAYYLIDESRPPAVPGKSTWTGSYFTPGFDFVSWTWNMEEEVYHPPVPYPEDGENYTWSEETISWVKL